MESPLTARGIHSHLKVEQGEVSNLQTSQFCTSDLNNQAAELGPNYICEIFN